MLRRVPWHLAAADTLHDAAAGRPVPVPALCTAAKALAASGETADGRTLRMHATVAHAPAALPPLYLAALQGVAARQHTAEAQSVADASELIGELRVLGVPATADVHEAAAEVALRCTNEEAAAQSAVILSMVQRTPPQHSDGRALSPADHGALLVRLATTAARLGRPSVAAGIVEPGDYPHVVRAATRFTGTGEAGEAGWVRGLEAAAAVAPLVADPAVPAAARGHWLHALLVGATAARRDAPSAVRSCTYTACVEAAVALAPEPHALPRDVAVLLPGLFHHFAGDAHSAATTHAREAHWAAVLQVLSQQQRAAAPGHLPPLAVENAMTVATRQRQWCAALSAFASLPLDRASPRSANLAIVAATQGGHWAAAAAFGAQTHVQCRADAVAYASILKALARAPPAAAASVWEPALMAFGRHAAGDPVSAPIMSTAVDLLVRAGRPMEAVAALELGIAPRTGHLSLDALDALLDSPPPGDPRPFLKRCHAAVRAHIATVAGGARAILSGARGLGVMSAAAAAVPGDASPFDAVRPLCVDREGFTAALLALRFEVAARRRMRAPGDAGAVVPSGQWDDAVVGDAELIAAAVTVMRPPSVSDEEVVAALQAAQFPAEVVLRVSGVSL